MEYRVHRAGTEPVSMSPKFLNHREPKDVTLARVVQNMQSDEARVEILVRLVLVRHRPRYPIILRIVRLS
ncbi:hypothetical protein SBA1_1480033 [Candidatus Sulfotelmatobacter kueseliae]|uniref:Uncharacterized protein n=1 Tax=Candidatus Sulfotelmatobacter kueseliae TaxID=2042962 RepID=A0A2U3K8I8_9BACT|nr:hypothetical protein SBA1_1480033 [Candidatus Sulfotelmatobacter kueseliae]